MFIYDLSLKDMIYKETERDYASKTSSLSQSRFHGSHMEAELHKALGMTHVEEYNNCFSNTTLGNSAAILKPGASNYHDHLFDDANAYFATKSEIDLIC